MDNYLIEIYVLVCGLCIGSFLNVCIYRLPHSKSIIRPRSSCPECNTLIKFYDNIPVLSYLWLKGRCRYCKVRISLRYPLIELITGLCAFSTYMKFGLTFEGVIYFIFIASLITISFIDIDHQIIPDVISLPGIIICFFASFALPTIRFTDSLLGILIGGGSLLVIAWAYETIRKRPGMGGGDIKLLAMIGALIGWQGVFFTIYIASAVGTVAGIGTMLYSKKKDFKLAIPFGPFLSMGAITHIFWGEVIKEWYFNLLR